jgi:riboflavin kinase/FMN adenylyltransferase
MTIREELAEAILSERTARGAANGTALTIGTFDGVHLGHRQLLQDLKAMAATGDLLSAVLTFRNHPRLVLNPGTQIQYITTLEERVSLIKDLGIDLVIAVNFTKELSLLSAHEFVSLLSDSLKMRGLVVGPDFALGNRREGDIPVLKRLGEDMGFRVELVEPVTDEGSINSSRIRRLISQGDVENASRMLGRWYPLSGTVAEGDRRGRTIGFPTANLSINSDIIIPSDGIYATWAIVDGQRYQAATCIGVRPTFGVHSHTIEAFIMDFQRDIYGRPITLEFVRRLRDEETFSSVEALVQQMDLDVEQAREVLTHPPEVFTS